MCDGDSEASWVAPVSAIGADRRKLPLGGLGDGLLRIGMLVIKR